VSKGRRALMALVGGLLGSIVYLVTMGIQRPTPPAREGQQQGHKDMQQPRKHGCVAICLEQGVNEYIYEAAAGALKNAYEVDVVRGPALFLPEWTLDKGREQYLADAVLNCVPLQDKARFSLGIVQGDLYTPGLNFVFGMAQGRRAVISIFRLRAGILGDQLFRRRVAVEAVHEVGHLLGLGHCTNHTCVMFFSNTLADTDRKTPQLCAACKATLRGE